MRVSAGDKPKVCLLVFLRYESSLGIEDLKV
jgi:hypothetical protein